MTDLTAILSRFAPGGGAFELDRLTIGVFMNDQPTHRLAVGGDTQIDQPLSARQGWILPAGASGICTYDAPLDVMMVDIDAHLLAEAGMTRPDRIAPLVGDLDPLTLHLAMQAATFDDGGTLYRETMYRALAAQLAVTLQPAPETKARIDDVRLGRAVDYIHDHLAEDLSLEAMAGQAAMSPYHFSRAFKTATGKSPLQYVLAQRIALAKLLLKTTKLPVSEICFRTGYNDLSRFGRHFKRATGTTPGQFRAS